MTELPTDYDGHVMRTPDEWCRIKQIQILDPDGWRGYDAKDWSEPLTELDFEERALMCTQRSTAGEHHTGTLNLTGEGNAPASPTSDDMIKAACGAWAATPHYGTANGLRNAMRAALEAAYPAIRQQVAEEIAAKLDERHRGNLALSGGDRDIVPRDGRVGLATGYQRAAKIAREIGGGA